MSVASTSEEASLAYSNGKKSYTIRTFFQPLKKHDWGIFTAIELAQQGKHKKIYDNHVDEWQRIWDGGNILMEGSNLLLVIFLLSQML